MSDHPSRAASLVLGTYGFGVHSHAQNKEIDAIRCALDHDICIFDTAPMYAEGAAEQVLGRALAGRRDQARVVTKINPWDANVAKTRAMCEASLNRLGMDYVDLLLVHWRGPVPLDETVEALSRLVRDGKILDWGVSNFDHADLVDVIPWRDPALPPLCNQILYNPLRREAESRLLVQYPQLRWMAYSPFERDRAFDMAVFEPVARRHGCKVHAVVLAWIAQKGLSTVFKAAQANHVQTNARAIELEFLAEELLAIDQAHPVPTGTAKLQRDDTVQG
jgi:diketogulonate reductase-like aldo/keto reductase